MLVVENLYKKYGQRAVVKSFSMNVNRGEVVSLLGPNGAGKTTSFYMITGLISADKGKITLNNTNITDFPIHLRAKIGIEYLPQEPSIFKKLTIEENIICTLQIKFKDKNIIAEKLEILLHDFHIEHIRKSLGGVVSGGERRRVEIARMLALEPSFVLLDEPFAGVDPISIKDITHLIEKLKNKNIGVVITDYNVKDALKVADRAYILYNGENLCHGIPSEVMQNENVKKHYLGDSFVI